MDIDSCYQLGYITKPHGLKGEVSIVIDADYPEEYQNLESVYIVKDKQLVPFFISSIKLSGNRAILSIDEINSKDEALALKGAGLYLPLATLPELGDNQFYYHEIVGFAVKDHQLGNLGTVLSVYDIGPQHILAFKHAGREVLLPINDETINSVERHNKVINVAIPDGLIDIYLDNPEP